jgi:trans-L-3-hydroxyproline dehydratase
LTLRNSTLAEHWREWAAPEQWRRILTVDAHAEGEPLRVVLAGFPLPEEGGILHRRRAARERYDALRTALMWEPRGHADMYGCILTPPATPQSDFGVLFTHNEGYSTMCGHGIIAVTRVVLELGLFPLTEPHTTLRIDTPAGLVTAYAYVDRGRIERVSFHNVPSFVVELDASVNVPGFGPVRYDLAFGGAFYAYLPAERVGLEIVPSNSRALIDAGMAVKRAVMGSRAIAHPHDPDLGFLYGTIFTGPAESADAHSRNVCIFAEGEVDRSPTGTGVSGRLAIHRARGEIDVGQAIVIESIIGSTFTGRIVGETRMGEYAAVVPEVSGRAFITGRHEFLLDPDDPLVRGFLVG